MAGEEKAETSGGCCDGTLRSSLTNAHATGLAAGFHALADPVRLRILRMLAEAPRGEVCVCDLVAPLERSQPTVSHHLKVLAEADLVHAERRGKWVWYSVSTPRLDELQNALGLEVARAEGSVASTTP